MAVSPTTNLVIEPLTIIDRLSVIWRYPLFATRILSNFVALSLSHQAVARLHWRQRFSIAHLQANLEVWSAAQLAQSRKLLTGHAIERYCQSHGLDHEAIPLGKSTFGRDGADPHDTPVPVLHFVASPQPQPDGPTLLYFHGGGFHKPIVAKAHMPFVLKCAAACHARQVVMLEYSLTPEHPFPCQLIQAVAALRYLLLDKELSVEDMILGGDSAGGHLILSLLTHLISPSPYAPSLDLQGRQLKAIVLVSPWASLSWPQAQQLPSAKGDYLTRTAIEHFYLMAKEPMDDIWALQCEKDKLLSVWKQLYPGPPADSISQKLILAVGDLEILYESCMDFGQEILGLDVVHVCDPQELDLTRQLNYVLAVAPGEAHVQPALDCAVGYDNGNMLRSILAFLGTC